MMQESFKLSKFGLGHAGKPDPALKLLDSLLGTWNIIGF